MSSPNPLAKKERISECFTQNSVIIQWRVDIEIRITINLSGYGKDEDGIPTKIHIVLPLTISACHIQGCMSVLLSTYFSWRLECK